MRQQAKKRYWWLIEMIHKNGFTIGAEIGCANGATTHRLLHYCKELKLYAVDKWEKVEVGAEGGEMDGGPGCEAWDPVLGFSCFNQATKPYQDRLTILRGDSAEMANQVPDSSLDFVFIDADHRYPAVVRDLRAWAPKLKEGGMLCGHDIHLSGVRKAVDKKLFNYKEAGVDHCWYAKKEDYAD